MIEHLNQFETTTNIRMIFFVYQIQKMQHADESLNARDQMSCILETNYIYNTEEDIILNEIIYIFPHTNNVISHTR